MQAPDPLLVREATLADLTDLHFPLPPDNHPLVWEEGDQIALRPQAQIQARACVLHAILTVTMGAPHNLIVEWLQQNNLTPHLTPPERKFLFDHQGDNDLYTLHIEAVWALAWVLGMAQDLDPSRYCGDDLTGWMPDLARGETYAAWRQRARINLREVDEVATLLDLYYCLDWAHMVAIMESQPPPGKTLPYVVGQRRWALEWVSIFTGRHHGPPPSWDEVDLTS